MPHAHILSSSLIGGGSMNPDKLALNLQFAADKTLTARKGPTPTFTRGTNATYVGSDGLIKTTTGIHDPRFDHDPVTLACKGLLIEELRTNIAQHSQDFSQSFYTKVGASISSISGNSPSGSVTIQKIVEDTSLGGHGVEWALSPSGTFTLSVFGKAGERQWFRLNGASVSTWFDLQNGVIGTIGTGHTAVITNFGNGWYRCSVTFTTVSASSLLIRVSSANNTVAYTGDGTSGLYIWGAQVESGAFPTSYIPTTTGTAARSPDVCSITSSAFTGFYNQAEGTLVTKAASIGYGTLNNNVVAIDNSTTAALRLFNRSTLSFRLSAATTVTQLTPASNYNTVGTFYTSAIAANSTGVDFVVGGSTLFNTTSSPTLTATSLKIGETTGASVTNNHISSINYFKKKLSIAKLQTITA